MLELLKNLALGRIFQHMQAAVRRKIGRTYRRLLREAIVGLQVRDRIGIEPDDLSDDL